MSPRAFGHTGFTGTSLWIDPDARRIAVLLTNRIHPEVREVAFNQVRQRFHAAAWGVAGRGEGTG
jgi:CubicO group peptidase (beta-lactamase class C family)